MGTLHLNLDGDLPPNLFASQVQGAIEWWQGLLREVGRSTFVSQANLLKAGGRPSQIAALARRQLIKRMTQDVGSSITKRWLSVTTAWSRKTVDTLIKEHGYDRGRNTGGTP